ncbi:MAG: hypothetical protein EOO10_08355 [Chitinophagaceae bacterium]|nr:MAG: hypothetical protein EOO10_08355 [Chitinophagaceae bacterium]
MLRLTAFAMLFLLFACNSKDDKPAPSGDNWVLFEKKVYDYKLNAIGYADTAYTRTYQYKDGLITDSSVTFTVYKYQGNVLTDEIAYRFDSVKRTLVPGLTKKYVFNQKGAMTGSSVVFDGKLVSAESFDFNDSNLLTKQYTVTAKVDGKVNEAQGVSSPEYKIRYDTVITSYKYDDAKKLVGLTYTDGRGNLLRTDVNIYSGNEPLQSHSVNPRGDTLQKVTYEKDGKILHTAIENDSIVVLQNTFNGFKVAQMTIVKKNNERWRSAISYDPKGRPAQEMLYKAM